MDHAVLGKKALAASSYEDAIKHYTAALSQSPTSPVYLIARSTAYQRAKQYPLALKDANRAVLEARKRAKREQIVEAQFRRGIALYMLERYGDAEFVLGVVQRMDEKFKGLKMWVDKCHLTVSKLGDGDKAKKAVKVQEMPVEDELDGGAAQTTDEEESVVKERASNGTSAPETQATSVSPPSQPQQTPADKIRHDWYQNNENIYFTLLAKGVPQDKAIIDITPRSLTISFPLTSGSSYDFTLEPLSGEVIPEQSTKKVYSTKIEVVLAKKQQGEKWKTLERTEAVTEVATANGASDGDAAAKQAIFRPATDKAPVYPTSSKSGAKDWDKVVSEAQAAVRDPDAKPGSAGEDDDYEGGDEANHFFQKLFKDASPEVQKAMKKSYIESNGTALSTNWEEVSKGPVETSPPDGMEAKKWKS